MFGSSRVSQILVVAFGAALLELHHNNPCAHTLNCAAPQLWSRTAGAFQMSVLWGKIRNFPHFSGIYWKRLGGEQRFACYTCSGVARNGLWGLCRDSVVEKHLERAQVLLVPLLDVVLVALGPFFPFFFFCSLELVG